MASAQRIAHLEHGAWWPNSFAAYETFEFLVYFTVFGVLGVVVARLFQQRFVAAALALAIGSTYSAVGFAVEPNLPFARYSHAPTWLWVLSWSLFYVPPIASALGAATTGLLIARRGRTKESKGAALQFFSNDR